MSDRLEARSLSHTHTTHTYECACMQTHTQASMCMHANTHTCTHGHVGMHARTHTNQRQGLVFELLLLLQLLSTWKMHLGPQGWGEGRKAGGPLLWVGGEGAGVIVSMLSVWVGLWVGGCKVDKPSLDKTCMCTYTHTHTTHAHTCKTIERAHSNMRTYIHMHVHTHTLGLA